MTRRTQLWAKKWQRVAGAAAGGQTRRARLGMEQLETRLVPALVALQADGWGAGFLRWEIANANPVGDTITLTSPGIYSLTLGSPGDANPASGDIDITGKNNLVIEGDPNLPPCSVTIDAQWLDRIFDVSASTVIIKNLNLMNGAALDAGYSLSEAGGAVRNARTVRYDGCMAQGNVAADGGAFANLSGAILVLNNAIVDSNWAAGAGGGVFNRGNSIQVNSTFLSNNQANTGGGIHTDTNAVLINSGLRSNAANWGGGMYNTGSALHTGTIYAGNWAWEGGAINTVGTSSTVMLQAQSDLYYNQADRGGGVFAESSNLFIQESTVDGNFAAREGGGVWAIAARTRIDKSTFSFNYAMIDGGGLWTGSSTLIFNSTFSQNVAGNFGGGIHYFSAPFATLTMRHATVSENWALMGAGLFTQPAGGPAALLHNSIVAINLEFGGTFDDVNGGLLDPTGFNNLLSQIPLWGLTVPNGNQANTNPMLMPLGAYGGPTQTYSLTAVSPALNAASNNPSHTLPDDQRSSIRPNGGMPDIGSFEV